MPLFYRIENEQGHGMYRSDTYLNCTSNMQGMERHPSPYDDMGLAKNCKRRKYMPGATWCKWWRIDPTLFNYGFGNLDQLKNWVYKKEWRTELQKKGFKVSVYKCKKAAFAAGDTQAVCVIEEIKPGIPNRVLVDTIEMDAL